MSQVAQLPVLLLLLLLLFVLWVPLVASPPKTREQVVYVLVSSLQPRRLGEILVVINWLDLYTVESAARYG